MLSSTHTKNKTASGMVRRAWIKNNRRIEIRLCFVLVFRKTNWEIVVVLQEFQGGKQNAQKARPPIKKTRQRHRKRQYTRRKNVAPLTPLEEAHRRARLIEAKYDLPKRSTLLNNPNQSKRNEKIKKTNE